MATKTERQLEAAAVQAHGRGDDWNTYWRQHGQHVATVAAHDRRRFHALVRRLTALVAAGDLDGAVPLQDGYGRPMDWELDTEAEIGG